MLIWDLKNGSLSLNTTNNNLTGSYVSLCAERKN